MNAIDTAVAQYMQTIADLLARLGNMAIENAGLKGELVSVRQELEKTKTPAAAAKVDV